ncbi:hypothetical protein BDW74DRAFT_175517 [Aspergillus multicolor]|uniref:uncharacterized protein n=1 Tax=Aspergillus multicolor TaxID=41759 RepID=UPI003CCD26B9
MLAPPPVPAPAPAPVNAHLDFSGFGRLSTLSIRGSLLFNNRLSAETFLSRLPPRLTTLDIITHDSILTSFKMTESLPKACHDHRFPRLERVSLRLSLGPDGRTRARTVSVSKDTAWAFGVQVRLNENDFTRIGVVFEYPEYVIWCGGAKLQRRPWGGAEIPAGTGVGAGGGGRGEGEVLGKV